ncbi:hypothetical protein H4R21_006676 [Coemansia helicoidea]|uniref:Uncharacterized protein n=1 Tax=Coemansia helicoidea TaxID=1286919 RepID=A0ACC1KHB7_9FUNG|nr:hypothetical protein H4R21_006676 [Coemansia helicoidea]
MARSTANVNSFGRLYSASQSPADTGPPLSTHSPSPAPGPTTAIAATSGPLARQPHLAVLADAVAAARRSELAPRAGRPQSWCAQGAAGDTAAAARLSEYAHTRNDQWLVGDTPARLDYLYGHSSRVVLVSQHSRPKHASAYQLAPPDQPRAAAMPHGAGCHPKGAQWMPPALSPPAPFAGLQLSCAASPSRRPMSLMDVLNAPPEQRKLPPLPPAMP